MPVVAAPVIATPVVVNANANASLTRDVARLPVVTGPWGVAVHPAAASSAALIASVAASSTQMSLPRKLKSWWHVTAISAGASAVLTFAVMIAGSDPASASTTEVSAPAPIVVSYDPTLLEEVEAKPIIVAPEGVDESARVLARRIALRGTRNEAGGLPKLARAAFAQALQHDPACRPALAGLGRLAFEAGRWNEAAEHLDHALRIEPRDAPLQEMLAKTHEKLGHQRGAARHFRLAQRHR